MQHPVGVELLHDPGRRRRAHRKPMGRADVSRGISGATTPPGISTCRIDGHSEELCSDGD